MIYDKSRLVIARKVGQEIKVLCGDEAINIKLIEIERDYQIRLMFTASKKVKINRMDKKEFIK